MNRERVAVVGAGIAGLTAAYQLRHRYDVLLLERRDKAGGHANTAHVVAPDGANVHVDTGFLVHNVATYPNLVRLFADLGVATRETDMSMSVRCGECGLVYAGGKRGTGLLPGGGRGVLRRYWRMLAEIPRFHRAARALLDHADLSVTLGEMLVAGRYSRYFVEHYVLPLVSAVWSVGERGSARYPVVPLFAFLHNHGLLSTTSRLRWRTVVGGSRTYVDRITAKLPEVRLGAPVRAVRRHADGVEVVDDAGTVHDVDRVVLACHADQALALLTDPTVDERSVLGVFEYSRNETWLHTDTSVLPVAPRLGSSWNYLKRRCSGDQDVGVSYHVNRLMCLSEPVDYVVTLNGAGRVDESSVIDRMVYEHPVYTVAAIAAQRRLPALATTRTAYAGAYHGWGFHEDGCLSGLRAAAALGASGALS